MNNKKLLKHLFIFLLFFMLPICSVWAANVSTIRGKLRQMDRICWEIGRTASYPSMCKSPTKVAYKGLMCWGCPEATRCKPACKGGKVCMNQKCVCPPNQLLIDCYGRCIDPMIPCKK